MQSNEQNETFEYNYSAKEQEEIKNIREKYLPTKEKEKTKMDKLRELDESVHKTATVVSMIVGMLGLPFLGVGLSIVTSDHGTIFYWGILIGVIGLILMALALPAYRFAAKKKRERVAPEIIRLTDELMKR